MNLNNDVNFDYNQVKRTKLERTYILERAKKTKNQLEIYLCHIPFEGLEKETPNDGFQS